MGGGGHALAWIVPAVLGIVGMVSQNAQTKAANANNSNQQAAELANAQTAAINAQELMAPWLTAGASPLGKTSVANPTGPLSLGAVPGQGAGGTQPAPTQVMQPPAAQPPQQQPQRRMPQATRPMGGQPGQPPPNPQAQPQGLSPMQAQQVQAIMQAHGGARTVNTAPVAL